MPDLNELFEDTLRDIYYAEKKILKALPKMAKKASARELRSAFEKHLEQTAGQVERLERVFKLLDKPARGKKCPAINGILEEGSELISEHEPGAGLDAAMAAAAQAVEHYEIARYGTLVNWAKALNFDDVVSKLEATLEEEKRCDEDLTRLAISELNDAAADPTKEADNFRAHDRNSAMKPKKSKKSKGKHG